MAFLATKQENVNASVGFNQVNNNVNITQSIWTNHVPVNWNANKTELKQASQSVQQSNQINNDVFSEYPYESSRDGMVDIAIAFDNTQK